MLFPLLCDQSKEISSRRQNITRYLRQCIKSRLVQRSIDHHTSGREEHNFNIEHDLHNISLLLTFCLTFNSAEKMFWLTLRNLTSDGRLVPGLCRWLSFFFGQTPVIPDVSFLTLQGERMILSCTNSRLFIHPQPSPDTLNGPCDIWSRHCRSPGRTPLSDFAFCFR